MQNYLPKIENVTLVDHQAAQKCVVYGNVGTNMSQISCLDLRCIFGFKNLKKLVLNVSRFQNSGNQELFDNPVTNNVKELHIIEGNGLLSYACFPIFYPKVFPNLEKVIIDPSDHYGRRLGPVDQPEWKDLWSISDLVANLNRLGAFKNLQIWNMVIVLFPDWRPNSEARMDVLKDGLKVVHEKFPLDAHFEIIDQISGQGIIKEKWKEAVLKKVREPLIRESFEERKRKLYEVLKRDAKKRK